jgi:hypothetical protein
MKHLGAGVVLLCVAGSPDFAQMPNAAPLKSMPQARSYSIENHSGQTVVSALANMTDQKQVDLLWGHPLANEDGRDVAVKTADCLAALTVKLKSGKILRTQGPQDCHDTRITVTKEAIAVGTSASSRPPTD